MGQERGSNQGGEGARRTWSRIQRGSKWRGSRALFQCIRQLRQKGKPEQVRLAVWGSDLWAKKKARKYRSAQKGSRGQAPSNRHGGTSAHLEGLRGSSDEVMSPIGREKRLPKLQKEEIERAYQ